MKNILRGVIVALMLICWAAGAYAADVIAVLDFKSLMADEELGIAVAEILRTELASLGDYTIIERGMLESILEEQALQSSGAIDSETAVEIGKLLGATLVVTGSIVKTGDVYTINSRFIDMETGLIKTGQNIRGEGENEISNMVRQLALVITGRTIVSEEAISTPTPLPAENATPLPVSETVAASSSLMLFSFEQDDAGRDWKISSQNITVNRVQKYASDGTHAVQIDFPESREQEGVATNQVPSDWSAYTALEFQVYWDSEDPEQDHSLWIALEDGQAAEGRRFLREFPLNPGANQIAVDLNDVAQQIDMSRVARLAIASRNSERPFTVYIDGIQLSTAGRQERQPGMPDSDADFTASPQEALNACDGKQPGDACQFTAPHGSVSGTCQPVPNQQLGCVPAGGPPQRRPGGQTRPPRR